MSGCGEHHHPFGHGVHNLGHHSPGGHNEHDSSAACHGGRHHGHSWGHLIYQHHGHGWGHHIHHVHSEHHGHGGHGGCHHGGCHSHGVRHHGHGGGSSGKTPHCNGRRGGHSKGHYHHVVIVEHVSAPEIATTSG
ncbi:hypothetical protein LOK49_LG08G02760 [Camellia lanceoleosa]|uniref:Uncharacterized protein n=1 Tax=Camellia lanceoleosa TaxID=1840588 RepID=A0ACC0GR11_9ERIC|nr:hypothetical protein LOK49_LG08G02760 [Camellia lanceoleosa]